MKARLILAILLACFTLSSGTLSGFEQRRPITLDVTDFELSKLARNFATMADAELEAPSELLDQSVTLRVERVRWQTALDALCDTAGCDWEVAGQRFEKRLRLTPRESIETKPKDEDPTLYERLNSPVSFQLQQADAREALSVFARMSGFGPHIDAEVGGAVTLNADGVRLTTALDIVCQSVGCDWLVEGENLVVSPIEALRAELPPGLGEPTTMSLKEADGCEILSVFERITRLEVERPVELCDRPVTIEAHRLPASRILSHLTKQWGATWRVEGKRLIIEQRSTPSELLEQQVDIDLEDASACEVLRAIAQMVEAEPPLCNSFVRPKKVLIAAQALPVKELLDRLCEEWGCHWKVEGGALEVTPQN